MNQKPLFSLCHPTPRFPAWETAARAWVKNCDDVGRMEYILCVPEGSDTPALRETLAALVPCSFRVVTVPTVNGSVAPWNKAAAASTGTIIIGVADDWFPCEHWDTEILKAIPDVQGEYVVNVDTGGDPHLMTHCILTRKRYERFGYLHHPDYLGVVADDEFTIQAFRDGVVLNARHLLFEHKHPNYQKAEWDDIYGVEHSDLSWKVGRLALLDHFGKGRPIFSVCHTTARLPDGWEEAARAWTGQAAYKNAIEYVLSSDSENVSEFRPECGSFKHVLNTGRKCAVDGWNAAAKASTGKFLITVADDWTPPKHWDLELLKVIPDLDKEYVVWVETGGGEDDQIMTFSLLTRAYYERYGYIFYPEYIGMFADNDFTDVAVRDGVILDCRKTLPMFEHKHPFYGTANSDNVYRWQHRPEAMNLGERIYLRRKAEGFVAEPGILTKAARALSSVFRGHDVALPRRNIAVCMPGETFSSDWLCGMLSVQGVLEELGFNFKAFLAYSSGPHVTRIALAHAVLGQYRGDPTCPYVLWFDSDNLVPIETIRRWVSEFDANPNMDILVGWCWIQRRGSWVPSVARFPEEGIPEFMGLKEIFEGGPEIREVKNLCSGFPCVMMRRHILEWLGPMAFVPIPDPDAVGGLKGEDASFFWRAKERGFRVFLDPMGKVGHLKLMCQEPPILYEQADKVLQGMLDRVNGTPVEAPEEYRNVVA